MYLWDYINWRDTQMHCTQCLVLCSLCWLEWCTASTMKSSLGPLESWYWSTDVIDLKDIFFDIFASTPCLFEWECRFFPRQTDAHCRSSPWTESEKRWSDTAPQRSNPYHGRSLFHSATWTTPLLLRHLQREGERGRERGQFMVKHRGMKKKKYKFLLVDIAAQCFCLPAYFFF